MMSLVAFGRIVHFLAREASKPNGDMYPTGDILKHAIAAVCLAGGSPASSVSVAIKLRANVGTVETTAKVDELGVAMSIVDPKRVALIECLTLLTELANEETLLGDAMRDSLERVRQLILTTLAT